MSRRLARCLVACSLLLPATAAAHRIDEYLQATLLSLHAESVQASMRLIPGVRIAPAVITAIDTDNDGIFSRREQRSYADRVLADISLTVDGTAVPLTLLSWSFPQPAQLLGGSGEVHIAWSAPVQRGGIERRIVLTNHHRAPSSVYLVNTELPAAGNIRITSQERNVLQTTYVLTYRQTAAPAQHPSLAGLRAWFSSVPFSSLFHLGMRHIGEGTDHLLFLLTLLLPAPLLAAQHRWRGPATVRRSMLHILRIVTAFTVGHSITLACAAIGGLHPPGRPVEVLIAVSILVSAIHALRPLVPGKEVWIAGSFGLIHGFAFAGTLDRLGLGTWERVAGVLSFNLGIEAMQILVVAAVLPSLLLLSRTAAYPAFRIAGALVAGLASLAWIAERTLRLQSHADSIVNAAARHAPALALTLAISASLLSLSGKNRTGKAQL